MPRKNKRAQESIQPPRMPQAAAPVSAMAHGFDVRRLSSDKPYRCPGCDLEIRPGVWHFVVVPEDEPEARRHWHERCWQIELNRTRGRRSNPGI